MQEFGFGGYRMAKLDDLLSTREPFPHRGLEAEEWVAALRVLADSVLVNDKRVLSCRVRESGNLLLIQTGVIQGACYGGGEWALLERQSEGWIVSEVI